MAILLYVNEAMKQALPSCWQHQLSDEWRKPYWTALQNFLQQEKHQRCFPEQSCVFRCFQATPWSTVRVVIVGQDPYHGEGQADGLAFSVAKGVRLPPSLRHIYQELSSDLRVKPPAHGDLSHWAKQGVLLLNTVLTVRAHAAYSHRNQGWEQFTDAVIACLNTHPRQLIFVLWGGAAQRKAATINERQHQIIKSAHPSPLSAYRGFFGSRPFSQINAELMAQGEKAIAWSG